MFLNQKDFDAVLTAIHNWPEDRVRELLRALLMKSRELSADEGRLKIARDKLAREGLNLEREGEYWRRLLEYADVVERVEDEYFDGDDGLLDSIRLITPPWEGITWSLDLLPKSPQPCPRSHRRLYACALP